MTEFAFACMASPDHVNVRRSRGFARAPACDCGAELTPIRVEEAAAWVRLWKLMVSDAGVGQGAAMIAVWRAFRDAYGRPGNEARRAAIAERLADERADQAAAWIRAERAHDLGQITENTPGASPGTSGSADLSTGNSEISSRDRDQDLT